MVISLNLRDRKPAGERSSFEPLQLRTIIMHVAPTSWVFYNEIPDLKNINCEAPQNKSSNVLTGREGLRIDPPLWIEYCTLFPYLAQPGLEEERRRQGGRSITRLHSFLEELESDKRRSPGPFQFNFSERLRRSRTYR
ncbi:hypothetical protein PoB_007138900 [Plakobranchus ocellatus]|uniref:Uncharacterized protein n=1 Tax=Plakobranchus ocellatus TaxID=259542 RepID=A0AAV4DKZ8_9GAST|nr:hypothetical protein PoB_007138900 [Plakobranchus ocellatus]